MLNNTRDFQETLHEVLNVRLNAKTNQEKILQAILDKPDKAAISEFHETLKKSVKPFFEDKLKKDLQPRVKKVDEVKKDINMAKQVKSGGDLNKLVSDIDEEKDKDTGLDPNEKETKLSSGTELTTREQTLKYMYSVALDEYHKLRESLYKYQIRDNDIALDNRNYLKLLKYENYLRKCDVLFKSSTGSYISNQDEEISKKENKYAYDEAKSERKVLNEHEDNINEIDSLNEEIENKANEIMQLNNASAKGNIQNYDEKLDILENEYAVLNAKMHMMRPNILELYRQEEQKEEQEKTTTKVVGTMYKKRKDKLVMDVDVVRLDRKVAGKEKSLDNAVEDEKNELAETNIKVATSYVDAAEAALIKKDTKEATKLVNKAKKLIGDDAVEDIAADKKTDFSSTLKSNVSSGGGEEVTNEANETDVIDMHLFEILSESIELSPVQKECAKAVNTPEERSKNVLAREAKEEIEKTEKIIEKEQELSR
ncbi:MAG: hypothetical protein K0R72_70 [Clostridia bacterium]|jgi:hypothetical protein|nr:hypothetical protein [Clostridia bacterium]